MRRWYWKLVIAACMLSGSSAFADDTKKPTEPPTEKKADAKKSEDKKDEKDNKDKKEEKKLTPSEQFREAKKQYDATLKELLKLQEDLRKKNEDVQKNKDFQEKLKSLTAANRTMSESAVKAAKEDPKSKDGGEALFFALQSTRPNSTTYRELFELAVKHQQTNPGFAGVIFGMHYNGYSKESETALASVLEKAESAVLKATTKFSLGSIRLQSKDAEKQAAGVAMLDDVVKNHAEEKYSRLKLSELAEGQLFEYRNLAIGKQVPDIEGDDTDGKKFKLSDYKGKVILLDFWAHW